MTRIAIVGTGYVGLCTGVGFALRGNSVACVDTNAEKVAAINAGKSPIYETGLEPALKKALRSRKLTATTDIATAVASADLIFIAVGTPSRPDGSIDLSYIHQAAWDIGAQLKARSAKTRATVVIKSTVIPTTTESVVKPILEQASGLKAGEGFGLAMNPEFLREGSALEDFLAPDRIVIGSLDPASAAAVKKAYAKFRAPIQLTSLTAAEMIKYASNSLLATKVSFANEVGNLCKALNIDTYEVMAGVGLDRRIGPHFLQAGCGFGGSCFSKDIDALRSQARHLRMPTRILDAAHAVNQRQREQFVSLLEQRAGKLKGRRVAVLGLAFKAGTDDVRDSPAIDIISWLKKRKARVAAYDPQAAEAMKKVHPDIEYAPSAAAALQGAHACAVLTDWPEFKKLADSDFSAMANKIILEGRRVLDRSKVTGFEGICW